MNSKPSWGTQPPHKSDHQTEFMGGRASHENWPPTMLQAIHFYEKLENEALEPLINIDSMEEVSGSEKMDFSLIAILS